jgi:hypothetical protein
MSMLLILAAGCGTTSKEKEADALSDAEREARIDALLEKPVARIGAAVGDLRVGIGRFTKEGGDYEPRVSRYIVPRLTDALVRSGVTVVERRELQQVLDGLALEMSDFIDEESRVEIGRLAGAQVLVLGTWRDLTRTVYRLHMKFLDLATGRIFLMEEVDVPRSLLPVPYGGL